MAETYCDYVHAHFPSYIMVVGEGERMPQGTRAKDWRLVKSRPADRLSDGGRKIVDTEGYAIIRVHVGLDELRAL